eukprot:TRINITY_DN10851_c0_g1_i1.p1 TRINITY_DN10851_c0_g1~~TRINITY_DN10851_c0_g1_i1.p1  ORF type:complete len:55 (+),score=6.22 TRINITY_DN10851_c0_g1_i1:333-497(+)
MLNRENSIFYRKIFMKNLTTSNYDSVSNNAYIPKNDTFSVNFKRSAVTLRKQAS